MHSNMRTKSNSNPSKRSRAQTRKESKLPLSLKKNFNGQWGAQTQAGVMEAKTKQGWIWTNSSCNAVMCHVSWWKRYKHKIYHPAISISWWSEVKQFERKISSWLCFHSILSSIMKTKFIYCWSQKNKSTL
jgi:hypothetical protein